MSVAAYVIQGATDYEIQIDAQLDDDRLLLFAKTLDHLIDLRRCVVQRANKGFAKLRIVIVRHEILSHAAQPERYVLHVVDEN